MQPVSPCSSLHINVCVCDNDNQARGSVQDVTMGLKYHINHIIATTYLPNHQRTLVVVWFYGTQASVYIKDEQDKKLYNLQVVFYVTIA